MTGKLITFEGPEGGGKSTQARLLTEFLRNKNIRVLTSREPGGTPTGEIIRDILQNDLAKEPLCDAAEALLFCASCAELSQFDEPVREKDALRVCSQCANPSYRFDEELFRLIAEAQHRGDPLSREDFRPILNAAAILAKTNTSYAFMSPLGAGTRSELGARILPNGHFRLKLTIGRDSFIISGKCD